MELISPDKIIEMHSFIYSTTFIEYLDVPGTVLYTGDTKIKKKK